MTFITRRLSLGQDVLVEPVLRRESLDSVLLADQLLDQARLEAAAILADAEHQRDAWLAQASAEFWQRANDCLAAWEDAREAELDQLVGHAGTVLSQGLEQVLGEIPQDLRLKATLRQLAASQPLAVRASLQCHGAERETLTDWLQEQSTARYWEVIADDRLSPGQLRLETPLGDFSLEWSAIRKGLLAIASAPMAE